MEGYHPSVKQFPTMSWCFYCLVSSFLARLQLFPAPTFAPGASVSTSCLLMWVNGMYETEPTWIKISMAVWRQVWSCLEDLILNLGWSHMIGSLGYMCIPGLRCQWRSVRGIYIYILGVSWIFHMWWIDYFISSSLYIQKQNHRAAKNMKKLTWMIGTLRIWVEYGTHSYFRRSNLGTQISIQLAMSQPSPALISADPKARRTPLERRLH